MNYKNRLMGKVLSKLDRIESKCDRILAELIILKHTLSRPSYDEVIDRLHDSAVRMRQLCEQERDLINSKLLGR